MGTLLKKCAALVCLLILIGSGVANAVPVPTSNHVRTSRDKVNNRVLHIKFKQGSGVSLQNNEFTAADPVLATRLNGVISRARKTKVESLSHKTDGINAVTQNLKQYASVSFDQDIDMDMVISELEASGVIEEAYPQPLPAPSPTASFASLQQYLKPAPGGVDYNYSVTYPGGDGKKAKIVDIEYSWNRSHEDLAKAATALVPNGTPSDPFNDDNHGTAVLGEMISTSNGFGVSGVARAASLELINANSLEYGWDIAGALSKAAVGTVPGDVIIVEQQVWGPNEGGYMPAEWYPEVYDAIKGLTDSGRIVVEPAANGSQNLDDPIYTNGTTFPLGKPDSGAIIVGAGENCSGNVLRSRLSFSNYGKRVNLQGPGDCVTTTGYGDLSSVTPNSKYTSYFNGTSSATPVIAAAAADVSSAYKTTSGGLSLAPAQIRSILMSSGTAQNTTVPGNIGAYPNLKAALALTDKVAPSIPQGVTVVLNTSNKPVVKWLASTDNAKVMNYVLYRNGVIYKTLSGTTLSYNDTSVTAGTTYSYAVKAKDMAGNYSLLSKTVSVAVK